MVFLCLARILRDKGILEYLEAARILKLEYPSVTFQLGGWFDDNPNALAPADVEKYVSTGVLDFLGFCEELTRLDYHRTVALQSADFRDHTPRKGQSH